VSVDGLLFALLTHAVSDIRRVRDTLRFHAPEEDTTALPDVLRQHFTPQERGQIASSAGFILDFPDTFSVPYPATKLSRRILEAERTCLDELFAATAAAMPWRSDFPEHCLRCGAIPGGWRPAILSPSNLPVEMTWRYSRPENSAPLCRKCAEQLNWHRDEKLRYNLALGLWGPRFEAFCRWHVSVLEGRLPTDWNRQEYPLWPPQFGGTTWGTGSGALEHSHPRPPDQGIARTAVHQELLSKILDIRRKAPKLEGRLATSPFRSLVDSRPKEFANARKSAASKGEVL
jgi:hypothetical protein